LSNYFNNTFSESIWRSKYKAESDTTIEDTWRRMLRTLNPKWDEEYSYEYATLSNFEFVPGGRIQSAIGSGKNVTAFNCYMMDDIDDSMDDIFRVLGESARTQKFGGGVGYNFSTLRPAEAQVGESGQSSGPLSFMDIYDTMTKTVVRGGGGRGAQMGIMIVQHPNILDFIEAKRGKENSRFTQFNVSVDLMDKFMNALKKDQNWTLEFNGEKYDTIKASEIMDRISRNAYDFAEPGVVFLDRINQLNNLWYCEQINGTNPCGEVPLPKYGACLLGSMGLPMFVRWDEDEQIWYFDFDELAMATGFGVRFLDRVIDEAIYPLEAQKQEALSKRRMGLGVMGFGSVLNMLGMKYGSDECMTFIDQVMTTQRDAAYWASINLAKEHGSFPLFDQKKYLEGKYIKTLPKEIREAIAEHGIRNSHLLSIAPTGTIAIEANCMSGSIEPVWQKEYSRNVLDHKTGETNEEAVTDYAYKWMKENGINTDDFEELKDIHPKTHIEVQARFQQFVDQSISKTINVPESYSYQDFKDLYLYAYDQGCKGLTLYRSNPKMESIINLGSKKDNETTQKLLPQGKTERPFNLHGGTYRLAYKQGKGNLYVTINEDRDREGHPFEVFINNNDGGEAEVWIKALARMLSAVMPRTDQIKFIIDSFEKIADSSGGCWTKWPSDLEHTLGQKSTTKYFDQNTLDKDVKSVYVKSGPHAIALMLRAWLAQHGNTQTNGNSDSTETLPCPECSAVSYRKESGCWICGTCGYSTCS
jgi:ribonucleoside-diphosphate reductase alpha chain